jgi:hypothetical protein
MSSLRFHKAKPGADCSSRRNEPIGIVATCQEAQHYPIYDPTNPEHEPTALSNGEAQDLANHKRKAFRSPKKLPHWKHSPSPKKPSSSSRSKSRLLGLADTLRAKATIFYEIREPSSEEALLPHEASVPPTPGSAKSISSKKSVRFRSGHSVIGHMDSQSSPITIPTKSPPSLPMMNISNIAMFETTPDEEKNLGQTARPPETMPSHVPSGPSPRKSSRPGLCIETGNLSSPIQALPTPMPGTNLSLEDPFDDAAATLHPPQLTSNLLMAQVGSDKGYITDEESNAETHGIKTAANYQTESSSGQGSPHSLVQKNNSTDCMVSPLNSDQKGQSANSSPSPAQRTLRRMKPLPSNIQMQLCIPRLPSETQYDADCEPSDSGGAQQQPIDGMPSKLERRSGGHDKDTDQDSQFGADLVRCKTPVSQRPEPNDLVPRLTLRKPSSNETEEFSSYLSSSNEAGMYLAGQTETRCICPTKTFENNTMQMANHVGRLTSINLCPTAGNDHRQGENIENAVPECLMEPIKVFCCSYLHRCVKNNHE